MNEVYCESCGMPMKEDMFGTEKDGSKNSDYCVYCYAEGKFTTDVTMEEMIEISVEHMKEMDLDFTPDEARAQMREYYPKMKRWKN